MWAHLEFLDEMYRVISCVLELLFDEVAPRLKHVSRSDSVRFPETFNSVDPALKLTPHRHHSKMQRRYKVHEGASEAAVPPAQGVGAVREDGGERIVQPFVGVYGARADRIDAWAMRKPAGAEAWIPDYPKKLLAKGPKGVDGVAMGKARVGPDVVGPIGETSIAIRSAISPSLFLSLSLSLPLSQNHSHSHPHPVESKERPSPRTTGHKPHIY